MKVIAMVLMVALAACAQLQRQAERADTLQALDALLGDAVQLTHAPASEQKKALSAAQRQFSANGRPINRLRLAVLLATLPPPLREEGRARDLLEPLADAASPGIGRFAAFLSTQIDERQRLSREIERLTRERASLEHEHQASDRERDKREEALRQQLEALRAIERGILEREERLRKRSAGKP